MSRFAYLGFGIIAGIAGGMAAIDRLHAQIKSPGAYVVVDVSEISNPEAYKEIGPKSGPAAIAAGGRLIARTDNIIALSGTPPKRFVIIAFDSIDKAKAFDTTPAQQEVNALTERAIKARRFIVEGM